MRERVECDPAAGAGTVLDDDLLTDQFGQTVGDDPPGRIHAAAGRKADFKFHDARRPVGCSGVRTRSSKWGKHRSSAELQQTPTL